MSGYSRLYFVNNFASGVCVEKCPEVKIPIDGDGNVIDEDNNSTETETTNTTYQRSDVRTLMTFDGVWQVEGALLDPSYVNVANYSKAENVVRCTDTLCYPNPSDPPSSWTTTGINQGLGFAYYAGDTYEVLLRCYYTVDAENEIADAIGPDEVGTGLVPEEDIYDFFNKLYADLWVARYYILGFGFGLSLVFSLFYIYLMRIPFLLNTLVWASIFLTICLFILGGWFTLEKADEWDDEEPQTLTDRTIRATRIAGYCMFVVGGLIVVLTCCLRKQIAIAIGCVKTAGKAVNHMFGILAVPVIQGVGLIAFLIIWTVYAVYLASLGDITTREIPLGNNVQITVRQYEFDPFVVRCGWFLLFCLFWTANFITAVGDMTVALAVARYYFTREKWRIGTWTVFHAMWQVFIYHAGTCAYGSLLIAIIQVIRAAIAKAQRAANKADNKLAKCILCCCQCCFACMECCMKFISKNAYIQTAIFSTPFCKSCRKAFFLIARNAARIAALSYVSSAVLIIGKLFISSVVTLASYYLIVENINDDLNSSAGPTVIIFLISYWVSDYFMDVFDVCITAVLHCFIADEEMFTDEIYAEGDLKKYIDEHGAEKSDDIGLQNDR